MGQQVSVETFTSSRDSDGNKYWTSFDPYPFKVGSKKLVYMGILNGDGPLKGQKCVVKTVRRGAICQQDWLLESGRAKLSREMAKAYNKMVAKQERKITFNCPIMAEIDTMSDCLCINDVLGKPKKKWKESEHVSIELYLRGKFEDYEYGWVPAKDLVIPESFSHFTWCKSEGNLIVSNLQGVMDEEAFHFTGPTIHSEDKRFGTSDLGHDGIKGFFKLHKCNRVCKNWPRLGDCIDLRGWSEHWGQLIGHGANVPSAPPSPQLCTPTPPPYMESEFTPYSRFVDRNDYTPASSMTSHTRSQRSSCASLQGQGRHPVNQMQLQHPVQSRTAQVNRSTSLHRQGSFWRRDGDRGMLIDWREEFLNQTTLDGQDNPMFQNELFSMQLMWVVKQMSYAVYAPPPPYSLGFRPDSGCLPDYKAIEKASEKKDYYAEIDDVVNQPPPYSEENVDPNLEYVTYL